MALFKHDNMDLITSYRFGYELRRYTNDGEAIEFHVRPTKHAEERIVVVVSLQFGEVVELLTYYEKMRKWEKQVADEGRRALRDASDDDEGEISDEGEMVKPLD